MPLNLLGPSLNCEFLDKMQNSVENQRTDRNLSESCLKLKCSYERQVHKDIFNFLTLWSKRQQGEKNILA